MRLHPGDEKFFMNLGFAYIKRGELAKGLGLQKPCINYNLEYIWDGSGLSGKTILLRDEDGIGDVFFWLRYAYLFKKQGARVILETRGFLVPLLSQCPYIDKLVAKGHTLPVFDFQVYIGGSFRVLRTTLESIPADIPYMYAHKTLARKWQERLSDDKKFKIGICWDPQPCRLRITKKIVKCPRAIPLYYLYPLSKLEHVSLYSLQHINGLEQLKVIPKDFKIHTFDEDFDQKYGRFMDTAAVMQNLDLIITADTSVAHLAGALGKPVWVLLPFVTDWRWFIDRTDSPWYPTMKLFRNRERESSVF